MRLDSHRVKMRPLRLFNDREPGPCLFYLVELHAVKTKFDL